MAIVSANAELRLNGQHRKLEHLRTYPSVTAALARNELGLHGWVYRFETGQVFAYDSKKERFLPIDAAVD